MCVRRACVSARVCVREGSGGGGGKSVPMCVCERERVCV